MTGALLAIRRHYDVIGLFVLALVSGVGRGLIRDGIFIQHGPPLAMSDGRYLAVVIIGCIAAALFRNHIARLQTAFLFADALGLGCYAVVGVEHALNAQLPILTAIMIGIVTACGGGLLRDVLVSDEPLLFKPGQLYVLAAEILAGRRVTIRLDSPALQVLDPDSRELATRPHPIHSAPPRRPGSARPIRRAITPGPPEPRSESNAGSPATA
jgi:uncharacterized membrane protein YeiH